MKSLIRILIKIKPRFLFFLIFATAFMLIVEISGVISLSLFIDFLINKEDNSIFGFDLLEKIGVDRSILSISILVVIVGVLRNLYFGLYIYLKAKFAHSVSEIISNKIIRFFLKKKTCLKTILAHLTYNI